MSDLSDLRRYAVARSLFPQTTLPRAIEKLGFVQSDPIRAPARAQDITLFHRVKNYRVGDLERRYPSLDIEEGFFVNYGFLPRESYLRMHPRPAPGRWTKATAARAETLREFVHTNGPAHPRDIDAHFKFGKTTNYWGGSSNATTHLLNGMHYRGMLRVSRRDSGVRVYAVQDGVGGPDASASEREHLDRLVDIIARKYAPLPAASLGGLVGRLRYATPQWTQDLKAALARAKARLAHERIDSVEWYWPEAERPASARHVAPEGVRLLSPFDPIVWDRRRFELLWGWAYRFEAYTPAPKRKLGYYALPLLWRDRVVGWANLTWRAQFLDCSLGFVDSRPREKAFVRELDAELERFRQFLT